MSPQRCSRLWEVEAARDARLSSDDHVAHIEHVGRCDDCASEQRALERLARDLREDTHASDEVAVRRSRRAVLQRADAQLRLPADRRRRVWAWGLAASVVVAVLAVVFGPPRSTPRAPMRDTVTVTSSSGARWRRLPDPALERIELTQGEFDLSVRRSARDRPVRIRVPEGEIEDLGTAFTVSVRDGRTLAIAVRTGSVLFHRSGSPDARITAGEGWSPQAAPPPAPAPPVTAAPAPRPDAAAAEPRRPNKRPASRAHEADASRSSYRQDASYLRILSLVRAGRMKEARAAALAYRSEFPNGFRRAEVERVLEQTP